MITRPQTRRSFLGRLVAAVLGVLGWHAGVPVDALGLRRVNRSRLTGGVALAWLFYGTGGPS